MPRAATKPTSTTEHFRGVEDFRVEVVRVGLKLCDDFMNGKTPDRVKAVESITMLFNAVK